MPEKRVEPQQPRSEQDAGSRKPAERVTLIRRLKKLSRKLATNHSESHGG